MLADVAPSLPAGANLFLQTSRPPSLRRLLSLLHHAPTDVDARHLLDGTPRRTRASTIVRELRDGSPLDADAVTALHCVSLKFGAVLDPHVHTSLLAAYTRMGANIRAALALFDEAVEPDIILWNEPVGSLTRSRRRLDDVVSMFRRMARVLWTFYSTIVVVLLSGCCTPATWTSGWHSMIKAKI
jgi:hypothetical protein